MKANFRLSVALLVAGILAFGLVIGLGLLDRSAVIESNCRGLNDLKTILRQDRLDSEHKTIQKMRLQGRTTLLGYTIPEIKRITERSVEKLQPSGC